ncbi:MAG: TVP38/TMEM64 family protein [Candidatus Omnitrophica bacterium]|nr:TVP38/TMEM64 family protein [Candidatus Omnitrophota bacterium]
MCVLKKPWIKVLIIIAVLFVLFLGFRFLNIDFSNVSEEEFKTWVESLGVWGPIIYVVVYVFRPLILFPAGVLSATAGVIWGPLAGFLYLQIAANISSTAEFLFARYFGRELVEKHLKGKIQDLDEKIEKHGFLTVLLIRLIPNLPWDVQNLSLGLTKVRFRDYFLATLIGIMPGSFAFVFFGSSLIKVLFDPGNLWMVAVGILLFFGLYKLQKKLKSSGSK